MVDTPSGSTPAGRRPTLRRGIMVDLVNGKIRVRKWPRPKGRRRTKAQRKLENDFALAQRASKYIAPQIAASAITETGSSPLLPRDLTTMWFYNRMYAFQTEDGKVIFPMPARNDVSASLDTLSQTSGDMLIRRDQFWEPISLEEVRQTLGVWNVIYNGPVTAGVNHMDFALPDGTADVLTFGLNIVTSLAGRRAFLFSTDHGLTFPNASGNYIQLATDGSHAATTDCMTHITNSVGPRDCGGMASGLNVSGTTKQSTCWTLDKPRSFSASLLPVNAIRLITTAGTLTSGSVLVLQR